MFKYIILFFFLFIQLTSANVVINEIMYNPSSSDNNNEYVELILDSFVNLTGYKIQDLKSEDILVELKSVNNNFALIVEEDFDFSDIEASVYSVGATIGNNLNNDNDVIIIKDQNDTILDTVSYNENWGASGNGKSLCKIPDTTGLWKECTKTIGENNIITTNFSKIEISEFLPNPIGDDNDNLPKGEWIELYNDHEEDKDLSGLELIDSSNKKIIISDTNVEDTTIIKTKDYLTIYMNGFSGLLNNEGLETISLFNSNVLIDEVSYSDSREGLSWSKIDDLWQTTEQTPGEENKDNSTIEEIVDSSIKIDKIYDLGSNKKAEWGSSIRVKLTVYKGETN
ncbi:MAG: lamin tail domain-containing protein, partial [Candidatus Nanoarchaeia archaeon]|nr:lamin tail domain-containing protein [Candidatus Nanoarchaeia archaeon]